jgi:hypothetical protein
MKTFKELKKGDYVKIIGVRPGTDNHYKQFIGKIFKIVEINNNNRVCLPISSECGTLKTTEWLDDEIVYVENSLKELLED